MRKVSDILKSRSMFYLLLTLIQERTQRQLATKLKRQQSNLSTYLNQLVGNKLAVHDNGRPRRYSINFSGFVSLIVPVYNYIGLTKNLIDLCKDFFLVFSRSNPAKRQFPASTSDDETIQYLLNIFPKYLWFKKQTVKDKKTLADIEQFFNFYFEDGLIIELFDRKNLELIKRYFEEKSKLTF